MIRLETSISCRTLRPVRKRVNQPCLHLQCAAVCHNIGCILSPAEESLPLRQSGILVQLAGPLDVIAAPGGRDPHRRKHLRFIKLNRSCTLTQSLILTSASSSSSVVSSLQNVTAEAALRPESQLRRDFAECGPNSTPSKIAITGSICILPCNFPIWR